MRSPRARSPSTQPAGSSSLTVTTDSTCGWNTSSGASSISVTAGKTGSGTVTVTASANTRGRPDRHRHRGWRARDRDTERGGAVLVHAFDDGPDLRRRVRVGERQRNHHQRMYLDHGLRSVLGSPWAPARAVRLPSRCQSVQTPVPSAPVGRQSQARLSPLLRPHRLARARAASNRGFGASSLALTVAAGPRPAATFFARGSCASGIANDDAISASAPCNSDTSPCGEPGKLDGFHNAVARDGWHRHCSISAGQHLKRDVGRSMAVSGTGVTQPPR